MKNRRVMMIDMSNERFFLETEDHQEIVLYSEIELIKCLHFLSTGNRYRILVKKNLFSKEMKKKIASFGYGNVDEIDDNTFFILKKII
jgi:hypothetical protein